jgi:hypothetical protein
MIVSEVREIALFYPEDSLGSVLGGVRYWISSLVLNK